MGGRKFPGQGSFCSSGPRGWCSRTRTPRRAILDGTVKQGTSCHSYGRPKRADRACAKCFRQRQRSRGRRLGKYVALNHDGRFSGGYGLVVRPITQEAYVGGTSPSEERRHDHHRCGERQFELGHSRSEIQKRAPIEQKERHRPVTRAACSPNTRRSSRPAHLGAVTEDFSLA